MGFFSLVLVLVPSKLYGSIHLILRYRHPLHRESDIPPNLTVLNTVRTSRASISCHIPHLHLIHRNAFFIPSDGHSVQIEIEIGWLASPLVFCRTLHAPLGHRHVAVIFLALVGVTVSPSVCSAKGVLIGAVLAAQLLYLREDVAKEHPNTW